MKQLILVNNTKKQNKANILLKLLLFAFVIIAFAFNGSGLMGFFAILLAGVFFLKGMPSVMKTIQNYPSSLKVLNLWVVFVFISGVFVSQSMELFLSAYRSLLLLVITINLIFLVLVYDFRLIKYIVGAIFISGLIQYLGPLLGFQNAEIASSGSEREYGLSDNPNSFGLRMVYASMALLIFIINKKKKILLIWLLCIPLFYLFLQGIVDSGSRKSLMAFIALVAGTLTIIQANKQQKINILKIGVVLGIIGVTVYALLPYLLEGTVVQKRIEMGELRGGVQGDIRYNMYQYALELFYDHPLLGIGLNNYRAYFFTGQYSHSDYAESLSSFGFFGFILYQLFYIFPIVKAYKLFKIINYKRIRLYLLMSIILIIVIKLIGLGIILYTSPATMIIMTTLIAFIYKVEQNHKNKTLTDDLVFS